MELLGLKNGTSLRIELALPSWGMVWAISVILSHFDDQDKKK
jgi:hypothetical protein